MLNSDNRLKKKKDFDKIFKSGKSRFSRIIGVKALKNNLKKNRYGIIVGTKVSKKAVKRNLIKRRLRAILINENIELKQGLDFVLIALPEIKNQSYQDMRKALCAILRRLSLYQENKHD